MFRNYLSMLLLVAFFLASCGTLAPSSAFIRSERFEQASKPILILINDSSTPIEIGIRGGMVRKLVIKEFSSQELQLAPNTYVLEANASDAMPAVVYMKAQPHFRYKVNFHLGMK